MPEISKPIEHMCSNPEQVVEYIKLHATAFQKTLDIQHNLVTLMNTISNGTLDAVDITILHNILHRKSDLMFAIVEERVGTLKHRYEVRHQNSKEKEKDFKTTQIYKNILENQRMLHNLLVKHNFLRVGEYGFVSWAIAKIDEEKDIIKQLLKYDSLGPRGGNIGELEPNQCIGKKSGITYLITKNSDKGIINATKVESIE